MRTVADVITGTRNVPETNFQKGLSAWVAHIFEGYTERHFAVGKWYNVKPPHEVAL